MEKPPPSDNEAAHRAERNPSTVQHEWTDVESLVVDLVEVVAVVTDTNPPDLDPLYETIDPDAVAHLFESSSDDSRATSAVTLSFHYAGCDVTVVSNGTIVATPTGAD